ncbi:MAG: sugar phosphate isomerase/epimerase [Opitutaceae bacterium]|nr:sugar phosphate isomerase/epimerase [Opitutaceae bacterium]
MSLLRLFVALLVSALPAFAAGYHDHLGLQLWSLRDTTKVSTTKALDLAAGFGFTEVETAGTGNLSTADFARELAARKLRAVAVHASYEALTKDIAQVIADAKTLGAKYVIVPWLPFDQAQGFTAQDAQRVAADFNAWGASCQAAGLKFGFHPHGFEFKAAADGVTPFDIIARETNPDLVVFEMDVFWVVLPGQDPVALLKKYSGRWHLMHVKDLRKGAVLGIHTGGAPPTDKVIVGDGQVDWPAVFAAAEKAGVKHYFIEDEGVQPLREIPLSVKYIKGLK